MSKLPVKRVVTAQVNLTPAGAQSQSLQDLLVLGNSDVIDTVERMRTYASLAAVGIDFGTSAPEYLASSRWFGQSPQPTQVRIGRWAKTATKGGLRCAPLTSAQQVLTLWTAINNAEFKIAQDGGAVTNIGPIDLTGALNLNGVAADIQAKIALAGLTVTCVWNATYGRFEFESPTTGTGSTVSFLTAGAAGTDVSGQLKGLASSSGAYVFAGIAAEALDAALGIFDDRFGQLWYGFTAPEGDQAAQLLAAAYALGATNKRVHFANTQDAATLTAGDDTCLAAKLKDGGYLRSCCQYSSQDAYAAESYAGRILTVDYAQPTSTITMKFKLEPGIVSENLSATQADAVEAKNCNVFVQYDNGVAIVEQGVQCDGTFTDIVTGTDWLATAIQTNVFNTLYSTPTKIPQTDGGVGIILAAIEAVCDQGVRNGLLAPGVWNSDGFGQLSEGDFLQKGYYVYALPIAQQDPTARAARKTPPIKIAAKLAGAIHQADINIVVNQ